MGVVLFVLALVLIVSTRGGRSLAFAWFLIALTVTVFAGITQLLFGFSACPKWFCLF